MEMVTMNMDGEADDWYQGWMEAIDSLKWEDFAVAIQARFGLHPHQNIEGEFSKLVQTTKCQGVPIEI